MNENRIGNSDPRWINTIIVDRNEQGKWFVYHGSIVDFEKNVIGDYGYKFGVSAKPASNSLGDALSYSRDLLEQLAFKGMKLIVTCQEVLTDQLVEGEWMLIETDTDCIEAIMRFA